VVAAVAVGVSALAGCFIAGTLFTHGINGWRISKFVLRADEAAAVTARTMAHAVSAVALLPAGLGVARLAWPGFDGWADGKAGWFGLAVIVLVAASYTLGRHLAVRDGARRSPVNWAIPTVVR
jgi:hypothetical protein